MDLRIILRIFKGPRLTSLLLLLSVLGPGIITAVIDNDAGGIATYSLAGSNFGYTTLWIFIPMIIALAVVQEMSVRMGIVSKKGLESLIREKTGVRMAFLIVIALLLANLGTIIAEFLGIAASSQIFGIPPIIALPLAGLFVWILVVKGNYRIVEKIFLGAAILFFSYIIVAIISNPDWATVGNNLIIPHVTLSTAYIAIIIALIGTTITPWMHFYLQASVVEKKIPVEDLKYSKIDAITGAVVVNIFAFFIIVACAATIFKNGIPVNNVVDISLALVPLVGKYAGILFAFGLLNASLFAASVLPLSTAYPVCEILGYESGVSKSIMQAPLFHGIYLGCIIFGVIVALIPGLPVLTILVVSQIANGILLPFVLILMLRIINDKEIMGEYVNSRSFNVIAWITVVVMICLSIAYLVTQLIS
ncbi:MAG: Nramp family divalent metal transporter [Methanobacterium sp.]